MAGGTGHARSRVIFFLSLTPFPQSFVHASCAFLSLVSFPRTPRPHWSCVSHSFTRKTFRRERMAVGHACAFPSVFLLLVDRWGDRGGRQRERETERHRPRAHRACACMRIRVRRDETACARAQVARSRSQSMRGERPDLEAIAPLMSHLGSCCCCCCCCRRVGKGGWCLA